MLSNDILNQNLNDTVSYADYFRALGYTDKDTIYFRRFKDKGEKDKGRNAQAPIYNLSGVLQYLKQENQNDNGIFYVVNGGGQSNNDVKQAKALFIDFDDFDFTEQIRRLNAFEYEPSIIVKTRKSLHCYWILDDSDRDVNKWRELQNRLINQFGSDPSIENPSRVMRLYGYEHRKQDPITVTLLKFSPDLKYNMLQFHQVLPPLTDKQALKLYGRSAAPTQGAGVTTRTPTGDIEAPEHTTLETLARDESIVWLARWTKQYNIKTLDVKEKSDGSIWYGVVCPWACDHTEETHELESAICVDINGKIGYHCYHGHCTGKGWREYRSFYEPAYNDNKPPADIPADTPADTKPAPEQPEPAKQEEPIVIQSGAEMIDAFLSTIQTREFEQEETGISDIDRALKGGFIRRTMVMLGAAPGLGKTLLMQWILENMAKHGHDVLYINLEMDRAQLLARSISRYTWQRENMDVDALTTLKGYQWSEEQRAAIMKTAEWYKQEIAPHFTYNPDGTTNKISNILKVMQIVTDRAKEEGRPAPLVCIDYLQLIDNENRDATEGLKNTIAKLKDRAKDHNTIIFIITANNRESNKTGVTNLESGRDTSAIEYTGDYMLGLSYTVIEDGRSYCYGKKGNGEPALKKCDLDYIRRLKRRAKDNNEPVPAVCNAVSLKINKNRFGEAEGRVKMYLDGEHSTLRLAERGEVLAIPDLFDNEEEELDLYIGDKKLTPTANKPGTANFFG